MSTNESPTFRKASKLVKGYDVGEVDAFFARARVAYEATRAGLDPAVVRTPGSTVLAETAPATVTLTSDQVRAAAFTLRRGGYDAAEVDAALDRLEDALAAGERLRLLDSGGDEALISTLTQRATTLMGRLGRPDGQRFSRGLRGWERTYDVREVDELCHRLDGYFTHGEEMSADDVRHAVFRGRRGNTGYREPEVDAFLDRAVSVMVAVD